MSTVLEPVVTPREIEVVPVVTPREIEVVPSDLQRIFWHAADLIIGHWIRGDLARDEFGASCSPLDKKAARFCLVGSLYRAEWELFGEGDPEFTSRYADSEFGVGPLVEWNDNAAESDVEVSNKLKELALTL